MQALWAMRSLGVCEVAFARHTVVRPTADPGFRLCSGAISVQHRFTLYVCLLYVGGCSADSSAFDRKGNSEPLAFFSCEDAISSFSLCGSKGKVGRSSMGLSVLYGVDHVCYFAATGPACDGLIMCPDITTTSISILNISEVHRGAQVHD